jgi:hypothetical protein
MGLSCSREWSILLRCRSVEQMLKSMNGGAVSIVYGGDGKLVAKTVSRATTKYLVDDLNPTRTIEAILPLLGLPLCE